MSRQWMGFSYLGTGVLLVLFVLQECGRFDDSQLSSPYFLLVPLFLCSSVPLILAGISWMFMERSDSLDRRVRSTSLKIAALIASVCLLVFASASIVSTEYARMLLIASFPLSAFIIYRLLKHTYFVSRYRP
jgi:cytochrome bd-type quinol oxidase subunit 2